MISEIDIRDWDRDIKLAREAIDNQDNYTKDVMFLDRFIDKVEDFFKCAHPQIPALFKPPIKKD